MRYWQGSLDRETPFQRMDIKRHYFSDILDPPLQKKRAGFIFPPSGNCEYVNCKEMETEECDFFFFFSPALFSARLKFMINSIFVGEKATGNAMRQEQQP